MSSNSDWKIGTFIVVLILSHFYIRSNITGEWAYTPPNNTAGSKLIIDIKSGGAGTAYLGGNDVIKTLSLISGGSQSLNWWQYGPVMKLKTNGKETVGVCLPFARKMYIINFGGITELERVESK